MYKIKLKKWELPFFNCIINISLAFTFTKTLYWSTSLFCEVEVLFKQTKNLIEKSENFKIIKMEY